MLVNLFIYLGNKHQNFSKQHCRFNIDITESLRSASFDLYIEANICTGFIFWKTRDIRIVQLCRFYRILNLLNYKILHEYRMALNTSPLSIPVGEWQK